MNDPARFELTFIISLASRSVFCQGLFQDKLVRPLFIFQKRRSHETIVAGCLAIDTCF